MITLTPEWPNGCPLAKDSRPKSDHDATVSIGAQSSDELADQLNRRRTAALRMAPLSSGVVDPFVGGRR